jgi:hypothetical protein
MRDDEAIPYFQGLIKTRLTLLPTFYEIINVEI